MYLQEKVLAYTIELDGGSGSGRRRHDDRRQHGRHEPGRVRLPGPRGRRRGRGREEHPVHDGPRRSRRRTRTRRSRTSARTIPDFVPATFPTSYGSPQTVEVNAKRSLGDVTVNWQINGGATADRLHDGVQRRRALRPVRASTTTACAARSPASRPATASRCGSPPAARPSDSFTFAASAQRPRQPGADPVAPRTTRALAQHGADRRPVVPVDLHGRAGRRRHPRRRLRHRRQRPQPRGPARRARPLQGRHLVHGHSTTTCAIRARPSASRRCTTTR